MPIPELGIVCARTQNCCYKTEIWGFFPKDAGKNSCSVPVFQNAEQQHSGSSKAFGLTLISH